MKNPDGEINPI